MNALLNARLNLQFNRNDVQGLKESMGSVVDKTAAWFFPAMTSTAILPRVPDGVVAGSRYLPPNITADMLGNSADMVQKNKRVVAVGAVAIVAGVGVGYWLGKRAKK